MYANGLLPTVYRMKPVHLIGVPLEGQLPNGDPSAERLKVAEDGVGNCTRFEPEESRFVLPAPHDLRPDGRPYGRPFRPGVSGNPSGRPQGERQLLIARYGEDGAVLHDQLDALLSDTATPVHVKVDILKYKLDRLGGKAPQTIDVPGVADMAEVMKARIVMELHPGASRHRGEAPRELEAPAVEAEAVRAGTDPG